MLGIHAFKGSVLLAFSLVGAHFSSHQKPSGSIEDSLWANELNMVWMAMTQL